MFCYSEHEYFGAELTEFFMNYKLCKLLKYKILSKHEQTIQLLLKGLRDELKSVRFLPKKC